jgi:hypothetical protein
MTEITYLSASNDNAMDATFQLLHEVATANIQRVMTYKSAKLFAERVAEYANMQGDSYLSKEARTFAEQLERLR